MLMVLVGGDTPVLLVNASGLLSVVHRVIAIEMASSHEGSCGSVERMGSPWWHDAETTIRIELEKDIMKV